MDLIVLMLMVITVSCIVVSTVFIVKNEIQNEEKRKLENEINKKILKENSN